MSHVCSVGNVGVVLNLLLKTQLLPGNRPLPTYNPDAQRSVYIVLPLLYLECMNGLTTSILFSFNSLICVIFEDIIIIIIILFIIFIIFIIIFLLLLLYKESFSYVTRTTIFSQIFLEILICNQDMFICVRP